MQAYRFGRRSDKNALLVAGGELYHIVTANNNAFDSVTSDLFLPKSIKSKNITIDWKSSDPATISDDGKISDSVTENREVSLYATIRVNSSVFTHTFSFRVTSQNNETKFAYLIAQLSPITLENVYSGSNKGDAFLYLPVVDAASAYDYRKNFATPTSAATQLNWSAYKDIRLEKIEYSVSNTYNYITIDKTGNERAVYLNTAVFYTYAQIEVTGKFQGDETIYTGNVNVIIKLGENKELNDLVFNYVDSRLQEIDVLQNILDTRLKYGLKNERGDFYLDKKYMTFSLSYAVPPASQGIISEIEETADGYWIKINPEGFYTSETEIGISVTIRLESSTTNTETRILYFTVPPVLKPDDEGFSNLSVFNSVKYQVFSQLPEAEKSETTISDDVAARLALLPPYGANTRYETGFDINAGATILENTTKAYILLWDAERCSKLDFYIGETESETDNYEVYRLMLLLQWATGTEKKAANAVAGILIFWEPWLPFSRTARNILPPTKFP
ncbi:MAG: immunoglobulin-like domain-containing protein [Christensenellaceae bacterium]